MSIFAGVLLDSWAELINGPEMENSAIMIFHYMLPIMAVSLKLFVHLWSLNKFRFHGQFPSGLEGSLFKSLEKTLEELVDEAGDVVNEGLDQVINQIDKVIDINGIDSPLELLAEQEEFHKSSTELDWAITPPTSWKVNSPALVLLRADTIETDAAPYYILKKVEDKEFDRKNFRIISNLERDEGKFECVVQPDTVGWYQIFYSSNLTRKKMGRLGLASRPFFVFDDKAETSEVKQRDATPR